MPSALKRTLLTLSIALLPWAALQGLAAVESPSPTALCSTPTHVYVAVSGTGELLELAGKDAMPARSWSLDTRLGACAVSKDHKYLFVTEDSPEGKVRVIDLRGGSASPRSFAAGHHPSALALSPAGDTLFVARRFEGSVACYSTKAGKLLREIQVGRELSALALTPDAGTLVVASLLPKGAATEDHVAAEVFLLRADSLTVETTITLPNGSTGVRGLALSPDGSMAYVAHILARHQQPATRIERGWMNTNAISVIDLVSQKWIGTALLDELERGAANPWGVACSQEGKWLCVTHAGSHELSLIDREALDAALRADTEHEAVNNLNFLRTLRHRLSLPVSGPRALTLQGNTAWIAGYFSDSLCQVTLDTRTLTPATPLHAGPPPPVSLERQGEEAFHDATRCFQTWQSCSSCHPDARVDALNWDLMNDGLGNPKNTKSMLQAHQTAPAMWLGVRQNYEVAVRAGFKHIQFSAVSEETCKAVEAYIQALTPVQSPHLRKGAPSPAALRGKAHFATLGCATCHPAPLYTDCRPYDLGTLAGQDTGRTTDTPGLVELWRTAPYLHDGSAATLRDVLVSRNSGQRHGDLSRLGKDEIDELLEYLLTL